MRGADAQQSDGAPAEMSGTPAFLDLEASGLGPGTWPIEAGWAIGAGAAASFLIKPHDAWSLAGWDKAAEALHGLTIERLGAEGLTVKEACRRLNAALAGRTVYSDAPDHDGWWLYRLYDAAGMRQSFTLAYLGDLIDPLVPSGAIAALMAEAEERAPHLHRAAPDVKHMQELYRLACNAAGGR